MPRPTPVRGIGPGTPAAVAARRILAARLADVLVHEEALLRERGHERVHDMRVACRRLRAALYVFDFLGDVKAAGAEVKRLQDALGEVRDRHVQLAWLEDQAAATPVARGMRRELAAHEDRLLRALHRFRRRGGARVDAAGESFVEGEEAFAGRPVLRVLRRRLKRLARRMNALRREPDGARAHELRKTVKKLRYEVEIVRPAMPRTVDAITDLLRPLQELLGDLHDHDVRLQLLEDLRPTARARELRDRVARERAELMARTEAELARWSAEDLVGSIGELLDRGSGADQGAAPQSTASRPHRRSSSSTTESRSKSPESQSARRR